MSIIRVSDELSGIIAAKLEKIKVYHQLDIDAYVKNDDSFQFVIENAKKILDHNFFVIIKNIGFVREKQVFESFTKPFGLFYGAVEYTGIKLDCAYTGCSIKPIELHNDDAVDVNHQPTYAFIQVQNEDPLKLSKNGMVKIDQIVEYLKIHDEEFLDQLLNTKIKYLSYGVNYDGEDKQEIVISEPILYKKNDMYCVRFDLTRIKYFYWVKKIPQAKEEKLLIDKFLSIAKMFREEFYLEKGDILIQNNKRTLHDRTECSIEINADGSLNTREIFVSFARENG